MSKIALPAGLQISGIFLLVLDNKYDHFKGIEKKQLLWIITGVLSCTDEQYLPTETETNK